jgi:hypothetical protein
MRPDPAVTITEPELIRDIHCEFILSITPIGNGNVRITFVTEEAALGVGLPEYRIVGKIVTHENNLMEASGALRLSRRSIARRVTDRARATLHLVRVHHH